MNHCCFLLSIMPKFPEATVEPSIERLSPGKRHFRMAGLSRSTKYKFQEFSFLASLHREIIIPVSLVILSGCHDGKHRNRKSTLQYKTEIIARITLNDEKETVKAQGTVPRKFIPGLSQILSKVFLSKNMQLELTKYCRAFTPRYSNDNTKCYSKQYIGR